MLIVIGQKEGSHLGHILLRSLRRGQGTAKEVADAPPHNALAAWEVVTSEIGLFGQSEESAPAKPTFSDSSRITSRAREEKAKSFDFQLVNL